MNLAASTMLENGADVFSCEAVAYGSVQAPLNMLTFG
jgi:hypothetical protein